MAPKAKGKKKKAGGGPETPKSSFRDNEHAGSVRDYASPAAEPSPPPSEPIRRQSVGSRRISDDVRAAAAENALNVLNAPAPSAPDPLAPAVRPRGRSNSLIAQDHAAAMAAAAAGMATAPVRRARSASLPDLGDVDGLLKRMSLELNDDVKSVYKSTAASRVQHIDARGNFDQDWDKRHGTAFVVDHAARRGSSALQLSPEELKQLSPEAAAVPGAKPSDSTAKLKKRRGSFQGMLPGEGVNEIKMNKEGRNATPLRNLPLHLRKDAAKAQALW